MNKEFWNDKTVLLTGHTGFKGSWLSLWLQKLHVNLIGFSKSIPTKPSLFQLANVEDGMTSIMGNVCDYEKICQVLKEYKPEIIIHMAAQAILRESYKDPLETFSTNVMGTVNLLESIRKEGEARVILNVTSDKCYEPNNSPQSYQETDRLGGNDPYSNSKACSELITSSFRNSFFNPNNYKEHKVALATCRAGNVIGGGDWGKDRLIPDIMLGVFNNQDISIRYPDAIRPWQHVLDPLNGYLILAEKLWSTGSDFAEGWNFGPMDSGGKSVKWIIDKITELWGHDIKWNIDKNFKPPEEGFLKLNCSKVKQRLDWEPKLKLEKGLEWTIDWYKQYQQNNDMRIFTEKQIDNFQSL